MVIEKTHSVPCCHCGEDHKDWLCPHLSEHELCKRCSAKMRFSIELDEKVCSSYQCGWPAGR